MSIVLIRRPVAISCIAMLSAARVGAWLAGHKS